MQCPVCKGTGHIHPPHVPADRGGWMDEIYTFGLECGACNGTGYLPDEDDEVIEDDTLQPTSQSLEDSMIDLYSEILFEDISESILPAQLRDRWFQMLDRVSLFAPGADAALRRLQQEVYDAKANVSRYLSVWDYYKMGLIDTSLEIIASRLSRLRQMLSEYQG